MCISSSAKREIVQAASSQKCDKIFGEFALTQSADRAAQPRAIDHHVASDTSLYQTIHTRTRNVTTHRRSVILALSIPSTLYQRTPFVTLSKRTLNVSAHAHRLQEKRSFDSHKPNATVKLLFLGPFVSSIGIAQATAWTVRGSKPGGGEIFRIPPDWSWGPPSLRYSAYRVLPEGKLAEAWR